MKGFSGFPEGKVRTTPIPSQFFSDLLPLIDHLAELKVTLHAFWQLNLKEGQFRYLRREDFAGDEIFMRGLSEASREAGSLLDDALERATARGTLLAVSIKSAGTVESYYFMNTPKGRAAVEAITRGAWRPGGSSESVVDLSVERPNVFRLYEQNIGPLTPMIAEALRDAEESYPARWIEEAMRIAVENNARKWRYVLAILEDWRTKGKDERDDRGDSEKARRRYIEGEFADYIEH